MIRKERNSGALSERIVQHQAQAQLHLLRLEAMIRQLEALEALLPPGNPAHSVGPGAAHGRLKGRIQAGSA